MGSIFYSLFNQEKFLCNLFDNSLVKYDFIQSIFPKRIITIKIQPFSVDKVSVRSISSNLNFFLNIIINYWQCQ